MTWWGRRRGESDMIPVGVLSGSDTAGEWALILCFFCNSRCSLLAASVKYLKTDVDIKILFH